MTYIPSKTVLETILEWSVDRPMWQRDALRRIVAKGRLDKSDHDELIALCKTNSANENGILEGSPLLVSHLPANPGDGNSVTLASIDNIKNANNLAPDQKLSFESKGITIIYGDNGAGKSGYVRILKRACRARHSTEIHPNIYETPTGIKASADFKYSIGGVGQNTENWQDRKEPHPIFSAVSVFDSHCASVHLSEKNEVAFRPFGLDIPDELANVCQVVKDALIGEQRILEGSRDPIFSKPTWKATSSVGKIISTLRHDNKFETLKTLSVLTEAEITRHSRLKVDLASDPAKAANEQKLKADNISQLIAQLKNIEAQTSDATLRILLSQYDDKKKKRETAKLTAEKAFSGELLTGVGEESWRIMWDAARRYSTEVAYTQHPFPPKEDGAVCVLCQQNLNEDAVERMTRFEEFIQNDIEHQAQNSERTYSNLFQELNGVKITLLPIRTHLQEVAIQNPHLYKQTLRFIASARLRRLKLLKFTDDDIKMLPKVSNSPIELLDDLEKSIRVYASELEKSTNQDELSKLQNEFDELNDRLILSDYLKNVEDEITRLKNINGLVKCVTETTTNAITKMGNDIADTVITPKLRDRFQEEIVKLAADKVRVEIVRSGGKYGSPQYQIRLFAKPDAKVSLILSEGEQTCVALASFLTELATSNHESALIFDDPVSSLDHKWRKKVAERLVEEASKRQIIIFTHDLVFLNDVIDFASSKQQKLKSLTVSRGAKGTGILAEGLPWQVKSVEDRIDKLEKDLKSAKKLYDDNEDQSYYGEATSIYNNLRATWERALEDIALSRVVQRHRDYINAKDLKKVSVLDSADCNSFAAGFKKCCEIVDAHDPSRGRNSSPPDPNEITIDIGNLKSWVSNLRNKQKNVA
jgi:energy-coupling factor transporter ATP-binding protein EcfA2